MQVSNRLKLVASFVSGEGTVADIGTDHGYIPIYLVKHHIANGVIAMDVVDGPLERARKHIKQHKLEDRITVRKSNGLQKLEKGEAHTVVIAGMGGGLVIKILQERMDIAKTVKEFVLSPQSEIPQVRRFLQENGFSIEKEQMIKEDGKYYVVMRVVLGKGNYYTNIDFEFGKYLIENKDKTFIEYLEKEEEKKRLVIEKLKTLSSENSKKRIEEISKQLEWIQQVKQYINEE